MRASMSCADFRRSCALRGWRSCTRAFCARMQNAECTMQKGEIVSIWMKRFKRGPMDRVAEAQLVADRGIVGNANQGGRRQVTIIDEGAWSEAILDLGIDVDPSARRANVMLRGVD